MKKYTDIDEIWLNCEYFEETNPIVKVFNDFDQIKRAYDIWYAANEQIRNAGNDADKLAMGFNYLKKVFNETSKTLQKEFGIDGIAFEGKTSKRNILESLKFFDIIQPYSLKYYMKLRNGIEHRDDPPPDTKVCILLSEYLWGFLRDATYALERKHDYFMFDNKHGELNVEFLVDETENEYYQPSIKINGHINYKYVSFTPVENWLKIDNFSLINNPKDFPEEDFEHKIMTDYDLFRKILFKGSINNTKIICDFIKQMILPERGELVDGEKFQRVFSQT